MVVFVTDAENRHGESCGVRIRDARREQRQFVVRSWATAGAAAASASIAASKTRANVRMKSPNRHRSPACALINSSPTAFVAGRSPAKAA